MRIKNKLCLFIFGLYSVLNAYNHDVKSVVSNVLSRYDVHREITVLEIGFSSHSLSLDLADTFSNSTCVMLGAPNDSIDELNVLEKETQKKAPSNVIYLKRKVSIDELTILSDCEHFDVVVISNIENHFGSNWKSVLNIILNLGDHTVITGVDLDINLFKNVGASNTTLITEDKEQIVLVEKNKHHLMRPYWLCARSKEVRYKIESTYQYKFLHNLNINRTTEWKKGINLTTFYMLNGVYPCMGSIVLKVEGLLQYAGNDFTIWNMIIQGKHIALIDQDDSRWKIDSQQALRLFYQLWNTLPYASLDFLQEYCDEIQKIKIS